MAKLPHLDAVIITEEKVKHYLLNLSHPTGRGKAIFFLRFGFDPDQWEVLAAALRQQASACEVVKIDETPFGKRYVIEGPLDTPDFRRPSVRSIWFVESGHEVPRLVSAYPIEEQG
ncbi:MAG: hypothetical protein K8J31_15640 [Anaerolineae bacterium]|nr:hypothetical protein [Anaerolineae bacterium]